MAGQYESNTEIERYAKGCDNMGEDDDFNKPISFGFSDALRDADNIQKDEETKRNAELGRLSTIFGQRIGKVSKELLMTARNVGETKVVFPLTPEFPEVTSRGDGGTGALYLDPSKIIELDPSKRGWREQFIIKYDGIYGVGEQELRELKIWQSKNLDVTNSISIKELCDNTASMLMKAEPGFEVQIKMKSTDPVTERFEPLEYPRADHYIRIFEREGIDFRSEFQNYLSRCLFFEITIDFSGFKEVKSLFEGSEQGDDFNNNNGDGNFEGLASLFG